MPSHGLEPLSNYRAQILKAATAIGLMGSNTGNIAKLMGILCDSSVDADRIAVLLRAEPALCARVLRVANSAFYARPRAIATIERAIVILGLDAVRGIAAAACLDRTVKRGGGDVPVNMEALLHHSLATATAAEQLARLVAPSLVPESFIGGLLHNLGIAIQVQLDPSGVLKMTQRRQSGDDQAMRSLEAQCVSIGHEQGIAIVFEAWQLPDSLVAAVANHHDPQNAPGSHRRLAALLNLGSTLALESGSRFALEPSPQDRDSSAMTELNVTGDSLDIVAHALPDRAVTLRNAIRQL